MKAVVLEETRQIVVREVPDAEMKETTDVLLRITSTAICGTDLHFYEGRMRGIEGGIIGHEPLGVVEEVGSTVKNVKKGDRVIVPTHICCVSAPCACRATPRLPHHQPRCRARSLRLSQQGRLPRRAGGVAPGTACRCQLPQAPGRARRQVRRRF